MQLVFHIDMPVMRFANLLGDGKRPFQDPLGLRQEGVCLGHEVGAPKAILITPEKPGALTLAMA